ncbi:MAG: RIP metalloprotease RseP [Candidatus Cryptobacteroides sp.]
MVVIFKILQVILALSLLIIVHEAGHFLFAKLFHIRVEKFYLFFDVGGKALLKFKKGDTEFGIGWLPFGGYCKIAGMVDESIDMESLKKEPQSWEFRTHPAWQRLLVMAGGVLFNFIFAILAYSLISGIWGSAYLPNRDAQIYPNELAQDMGFQAGDHIISLDDYQPQDFFNLQADLIRRQTQKVTVLRDADTLNLYMDLSRTSEILNSPLMFDLAMPFIVDSVASAQNAAQLQKHDRILSVEGEDVRFFQDAAAVLKKHAGKEVAAVVERQGEQISVPLQIDTAGRIGIYIQAPEVERRKYNVVESIGEGFKRTGSTIKGYLQDLKLVSKPSTGAYKSVGSFISIGQIFPDKWNWYQFLSIIALLSIMLGVMNLIPIPGLDGGHILFTLYEMISGRKPSEKFLMVAQIIGMVLLLMLLILAFGNDISRLIH